MGVSRVPAVIDALVSLAPAAIPATARVYDGKEPSLDFGDYLMVGRPDPDPGAGVTAATAQQDWATVGAGYNSRQQIGDVTCLAFSLNGDGNAKMARDAVYAIATGIENLCRTNYTLGVADLLWTSYGTSERFDQDQDQNGAWALLVFSVHFEARI